MTAPEIAAIAPFFIVRDVPRAAAFYERVLGFEVMHLAPADDPFFALVRRGGAMLMLKAVDADPLPNPVRDASARWDAFVSVADPDALAAEFAGRGVAFGQPLGDTDDGLRGFGIADPDGYVLFFGAPRDGG